MQDQAKARALEQLEDDIGYYDMPEHEDSVPVTGWALCEILNEVKRWRETHKSGEFSPDYCAASEALAEHLAHCPNNALAPSHVAAQGELAEAKKALENAPHIWVTIQSNGQPKIGRIEYGENERYFSETTVYEALSTTPPTGDA